MQGKQVNELSGGWRMRLAIARAMLEKADILYVAQRGSVARMTVRVYVHQILPQGSIAVAQPLERRPGLFS
jgi:ABC-type multidrug transport system fused ATPase/permease subunit